MSKAFNIALWLLSLAGIFGLLSFAESQHSAVTCEEINIFIKRPNQNYFVLEEDVKAFIQDAGLAREGMLKEEINVNQIERMLSNNPSIKSAEVYSTIDGVLNIELSQRNPIVRVFTDKGDSYYIDETGALMPWSKQYTSRVIVANGAVTPSFIKRYQNNVQEYADSSDVLYGIYTIAKSIDEDSFWKAQIAQVYALENGDFELIPRVGNHNILLGKPTNVKEKLEKLMIFYKKGLSKTGWNEYTTINLKYNNQVVCTKK